MWRGAFFMHPIAPLYLASASQSLITHWSYLLCISAQSLTQLMKKNHSWSILNWAEILLGHSFWTNYDNRCCISRRIANPHLVLSWIWILCFSWSKLFVDFCKSLVLKPWKLPWKSMNTETVKLSAMALLECKVLVKMIWALIWCNTGAVSWYQWAWIELLFHCIKFHVWASLQCPWHGTSSKCGNPRDSILHGVPYQILSEHPLGTNAYQQEIDPRNMRMETAPNNVRDCSIHIIGLRVNSRAIPMQGL